MSSGRLAMVRSSTALLPAAAQAAACCVYYSKGPPSFTAQSGRRHRPVGRFRVAVDTGGTFSDFVYFDEERRELSIAKLPSTPRNPAHAILGGVQRLLDQGVTPAEIVFFLHGTTVGTNAMLEEKGARTGLLITRGFRGVYEVGEQMRGYGPAMFDFYFRKPPLLARPRETHEVTERLDLSGA